MRPDGATARPDGEEVMSSVDAGRPDRLVIADVTRDDAWVSMPVSGAPSLSAWR